MVLGPLNESLAIPSQHAGHKGVLIPGRLVVDLGLRDLEARGVHVLPQHDLSLLRRDDGIVAVRGHDRGQRLRSDGRRIESYLAVG